MRQDHKPSYMDTYRRLYTLRISHSRLKYFDFFIMIIIIIVIVISNVMVLSERNSITLVSAKQEYRPNNIYLYILDKQRIPEGIDSVGSMRR